VLDVLPTRFGKYGLTIHPEKTRLVPFVRPSSRPFPPDVPGAAPRESFDFLGFTHFWSRSKKGHAVVKRKTAGSRFRRAVKKIADWCRLNRHLPIAEQRQVLWQKLRGHFQYYRGVLGNGRCLWDFRERVQEIWKKWLSRRGGPVPWPPARLNVARAVARPGAYHRAPRSDEPDALLRPPEGRLATAAPTWQLRSPLRQGSLGKEKAM
jgi:hypothetical protein